MIVIEEIIGGKAASVLEKRLRKLTRQKLFSEESRGSLFYV